MILADTSAWVEYLRGTGSDAHVALRDLVRSGEVLTSEPVVMEVLSGARSERHLGQLRSLLGLAQLVPCVGDDYVDAAFLYRLCRANGVTVRSHLDCLIAAIAIRRDVAVLHADRDLDALGHWTPLVSHLG